MRVVGLAFKFMIAVAALTINAASAEERADSSEQITVRDLVNVLDLNLLKLRFDPPEMNDGVAELVYWVESVQTDGVMNICDSSTIGINVRNPSILLRLPKGMDPAFAVISDVNSIRGRSKLVVDTENQGAEAWAFASEKTMPFDKDVIIAIRTVGVQSVPYNENLSDLLYKLREAAFNRIDVFKVRLKSMKKAERETESSG